MNAKDKLKTFRLIEWGYQVGTFDGGGYYQCRVCKNRFGEYQNKLPHANDCAVKEMLEDLKADVEKELDCIEYNECQDAYNRTGQRIKF